MPSLASASAAVLCGILWILDALLSVFVGLYRHVKLHSSEGADGSDRPHVVIVGGSFAGLWCTRHLEKDFRVTVVDYKDYFEYTPGCLRLLVDETHVDKITAPILHPHSTARLLQGEMTAVQPTSNTISIRTPSGDKAVVNYDYLLVGTGSEYPAPFKPSRAEPTLASRKATWRSEYKKLEAAKSVIVVGGGLVGTEVVGEIRTAYPDTTVTVVDGFSQCCANLPSSTVSYVGKWMRSHGVRLEMNAKIKMENPSLGFPAGLAITDTTVTLEDGRVLEADLVYRCLGMKPASSALQNGLQPALNPRGSLLVEDTLQVKGHRNIFGMGDVMLHETTRELKLGHTAEVNAHVVVENIRRLAAGDVPLAQYPHGATGAATTPKIFCLSLGQHDASLGFNSLIINGWLAALVKHFLEWSKVRQQADTPLGRGIWVLGDWVSCLLGRTLLHPASWLSLMLVKKP